MTAVRGLFLTIRFACELGMLVALAVGGHALAVGAAGWAVAVALPAAAGVVWGLFVAPKAKRPVPVAVRLAIEAVLFGGAAWLLAHAGHPTLGIVLAACAFASSAVNAATAPRS